MYNWAVSTGRGGHDTPSGNFRAFRMEEDHYSKEWDDAPMPNSIFFTERGHAIHGSLETRRLGSPASAGCVRLAPNNAKTLFALVKEQGVTNAKVVISGTAPSPALIAKRKTREAPRVRQAAGPEVIEGDTMVVEPNVGRIVRRPPPQPQGPFALQQPNVAPVDQDYGRAPGLIIRSRAGRSRPTLTRPIAIATTISARRTLSTSRTIRRAIITIAEVRAARPWCGPAISCR